MRLLAAASALSVLVAPGAALAHAGVGDTHGFVHGFWHPLGGIDHLIAMVLVGIYAFRLGGRALWLLPAAFMAVMAAGGLAGIAGVPVPFVEAGIALSAVILGIVVAAGARLPIGAAMALVGALAVFHGHAHGAEMPADASAIGYGAGFLLATGLLHVLGIGIGFVIGLAGRQSPQVYRLAGGLASVTGLAILTGVV